MNERNKSLIVPVLFCALLWSISASAQTPWRFLVVVHESVPADTLSTKELSKIFLKKQVRWDDAHNIEPVDLVENSRTRARFSQKVHRKKVSKIKAFWQKQIFTGRAVPPPEKKTDREVLEYVQSHPGGIGYVSPTASLKGYQVKSIVVIK